MVSPTSFNKNGLEWARWNPVGTGPFKFVSFQRDVVLKTVKFDGYWQPGKPYLDGIDTMIIPDLVTALAAFKTGEIHTIQSESPKMSFDLKSEGYIIKSQMPHLTGTLTLVPDSVNADSPLSNKLVRQAIEYAIDKEALTKGTGYGFSMPVYQVSPPNSIGYVPELPQRKYNVDTAKKLLADAGFPNGFKTKIVCDPRTTTRDVMVAIQSYLNAAGIQTDLDFPDNAKYTDMRYATWKNAMMCQLFSNFATYQNYFSFYWPGNQFKSTAYPAGFREAWTDMLTTSVVQKEKVQKLNKMMYDDSMIIPICNSAASQGIAKSVHDTGLFEQHHSLWSPSTAWIEKGVGVK
jgi:ABC-type transport system substrate-binding protein